MHQLPSILSQSVCHFLSVGDRLRLIGSSSQLQSACAVLFAFKDCPMVNLTSAALLTGCPRMSKLHQLIPVSVEWPPLETRDGVLESDVER